MSKALCNAGRQGQVGSEQNIYYFALEIQIFCSPQGSSQLVMTHFLELNEELKKFFIYYFSQDLYNFLTNTVENILC